MSEDVKESTSKIAKLIGVLAGVSTWFLYYIIEGLIFLIIDTTFKIEDSNTVDSNTLENILIFIFLLGFFPSYFVGCLINYKWQGFTKRMKIFVVTVSLLLIIPFIPETYSQLKKLIPESGSTDDNFKKDERIRVYTTNDKNFRGRFIDWNDDFLVLEENRKEIKIPKDKIHYIQRGW